WQRVTTAEGPATRWASAAVYDLDRSAILMFGGIETFSTGTPSADTWQWKGGAWTDWHPGAPPSRNSEEQLADDALRGRIVMFGGRGDATITLGDTWEWDGASWQELDPLHAPSPRSGHAMAFDPIRQVTVLFGGYAAQLDAQGGFTGDVSYSDTWEW